MGNFGLEIHSDCGAGVHFYRNGFGRCRNAGGIENRGDKLCVHVLRRVIGDAHRCLQNRTIAVDFGRVKLDAGRAVIHHVEMHVARRDQANPAIKTSIDSKVSAQRGNGIVPAVVDAHGEDVLAHHEIGREIEPESGKTAVVPTHGTAIQPHLRAQRCAVELNESALCGIERGDRDDAPVPGRSPIEMIARISVRRIVGMRQRYSLPFRGIEIGLLCSLGILAQEQPTGIERRNFTWRCSPMSRGNRRLRGGMQDWQNQYRQQTCEKSCDKNSFQDVLPFTRWLRSCGRARPAWAACSSCRDC